MVVDDQADFVEGVKLILEEEGYNVWTASNGREALDRLTDNLTVVDSQPETKSLPKLILADIMMPIMDGYALYEHTQANTHLKYIPFVFLTAKTDSTDIQRGKDLGVEDYLTKPCLPDVLLASVRGQLKSEGGQTHFQTHASEFQTYEEPKVAKDTATNGKGIVFIGIGVLIVLIIVLMTIELPWA